jgi:hypothetical protein
VRGIRHELSDIIIILAVICDANSYSQIHQYALSNKDWLKTFLKLPPTGYLRAHLHYPRPAGLAGTLSEVDAQPCLART